MKKSFFRYALLCIAILLSFVVSVSCSGSDGDSADYVSVNPQSEVYLEPDASVATLYIESSGNWTVSGMPAWLKVIPASGKSGDKLVIEVENNASIDERYTVLTVTCGTATATVKVTQYGNLETDYVDVGFDTPGVTYTYSASDGNLSITYNGADKPDVTAGSAIVLPAEHGYDIRVVESCSYSGNTLNMSTKEGNMCNLFRNIDFTLSTNPTATRSAAGERVFTPVSYGYRDEQGVYHELYNRNTRASYTSSESLWSFTGNFNGERIYNGAAGTLYWEQCQFDAGLDATLKFDFGEKDITPEHIEGDLQSFSYTITGNVGIDMLLHYNCEASYSEGDDRIIRKDIVRPKEILFQVGHVPVLVTVSTHLGKSHSFEAKGSIDATTGVKCSNEISVGLAWSKGGGVTEIAPTSTSQFSVYPPTLEAEASMGAKVSYYPQIELKLYKFLGPWVEPRPYLSDKLEAGLRASTDGENHIGWTATLAGGIDLRFGLNLGFGILDIIEVEKELWSSKIYNLVERDFYNAPARITKLSPADDKEVKEGESVTAEFLVESYCPLTGGYYPCPLALVSFEAECGDLSDELLVADAYGKVKVEWTPNPEDEESSHVPTRAAELVERSLTAAIVDKDGETVSEAGLTVKVEEEKMVFNSISYADDYYYLAKDNRNEVVYNCTANISGNTQEINNLSMCGMYMYDANSGKNYFVPMNFSGDFNNDDINFRLSINTSDFDKLDYANYYAESTYLSFGVYVEFKDGTYYLSEPKSCTFVYDREPVYKYLLTEQMEVSVTGSYEDENGGSITRYKAQFPYSYALDGALWIESIQGVWEGGNWVNINTGEKFGEPWVPEMDAEYNDIFTLNYSSNTDMSHTVYNIVVTKGGETKYSNSLVFTGTPEHPIVSIGGVRTQDVTENRSRTVFNTTLVGDINTMPCGYIDGMEVKEIDTNKDNIMAIDNFEEIPMNKVLYSK